ncbi:hypothetical protein NCAS_0D01390 [Naumovozyma castellii]|uniref:Cdc23 domain-containing protein n=1 Tax=Naumovozyma castellii TaxID=27288 RepID=G0VDT1_NAUCA|nr:hypothetical protein NCAS_0D01390 [Naumovozyma castellii CBS 4309]CCC69720.1 hypothetical protein NCAS_0D01390 [Naumovozyma castellii CBS 4309]
MDEESQLKLIQDIRRNLRRASQDLSKWKLYKSAKWAAEALCGMGPPSTATLEPVDESPLRNRASKGKNMEEERKKKSLSEDEHDLYLLASSLFDCKEFDRCTYFLKDVTNPCLMFLKLYSQFLSWDKKTQESLESVLTTGKLSKNSSNNNGMSVTGIGEDTMSERRREKQSHGVVTMEDGHQSSIAIILMELNSYLDDVLGTNEKKEESQDRLGLGLLYYLKGILLQNDNNKSQAMGAFLKSLSYYSFNWSCWVELLDCVTRADESMLLLTHINDKFTLISDHKEDYDYDTQNIVQYNVMTKFFKLAISQDLNGNIDELMEIIEALLVIFPNFAYIKAQNALVNYHYMDYVNSENLFEQVVKMDPYRLDDLDTYSNILYVMQKHSKLAYLAQFVAQIDKFRSETCCIMANYYSARQEHEKSIMYFRRALTLNKKCTSAWTLMGHEFVELKNSHAAIECYRRAVDINVRDFKAWYGLGQAYEVLDMHLYSLYYFQKACTLKPLDRRMWQALGTCYTKIGNKTEAIKCFERAIQLSGNADQDTTLMYNLAKLYDQLNDAANCKQYMIRCVNMEAQMDGQQTDETIKARLWLARWESKNGNYEIAYNYAASITNGTAAEVEEARFIAKNCQKLM